MRFLIPTILLAVLAACTQQEQDGQQTQTSDLPVTRSEQGVAWQAPAEWLAETPSSSMRKAQYRLPAAEGDSEDASVVIFYFRGEGGGVQANIDRWISQFEQPDGRASSEVARVEKTTSHGLAVTLVDVTGTYLSRMRPMDPSATEKPGFRMLAAVIETGSGPWFVKFVGPEATVAKWENGFRSFLQSFREET